MTQQRAKGPANRRSPSQRARQTKMPGEHVVEKLFLEDDSFESMASSSLPVHVNRDDVVVERSTLSMSLGAPTPAEMEAIKRAVEPVFMSLGSQTQASIEVIFASSLRVILTV